MALFITFEGIEGCGKTTQMVLFARSLSALGHRVTVTREPGGCPIADQIRGILLNADNREMVSLTELFLYAAARAQHMAEVIVPALERGEIVICDRFTDATVAYQGYGRGLDRNLINNLNNIATGGLKPDLSLLIDCPVEIGLGRAMARINSTSGIREERFELESLRFHRKVRDGYLKMAELEPERFLIISGTEGIEETEAAIAAAVRSRLTDRGIDALR
jgi:dTMP kinase